MQNRVSTYTIDLVVKDDSTRNYIQDLDQRISDLGKTARESIKTGDFEKGLEDADKIAGDLIKTLQDGAGDASINFDDVLKSYQSGSKRAIEALKRQYEALEAEKASVEATEAEIAELEAEQTREGVNAAEIDEKIAALREKIAVVDKESLDAQIAKNRQIRANLKQAEIEGVYKQKSKKMDEALAKYQELQKKRKKAGNDEDRKALDDQLKRQKAYIQSIIEAKKALGENTREIEKALSKTTLLEKAQKAYTKASESKPVRAAAAVGRGIAKAGAMAAGAAGAALGIASAAGGAAETAVEREKAVGRLNGIGGSDKEKIETVREIQMQTGADYGVIVDAINRVRRVMGEKASDSDVLNNAIIEVNFPGTAQAFASTNTKYDVTNANIYANRQKEIQQATGATQEQLREAQSIVSNLRPERLNSASASELQTVYLGLQNSGAFDSQDELEQAFTRFVRDQQRSGKDIFEYAQKYTESNKWVERISDRRNKVQAENTIKNINWETLKTAANNKNENALGMSEAQKTAMKARELEEKKNEFLIKLVPALMPVVESMSELLNSDTIKQVLESTISLLTVLIPTVIKPVFEALKRVLDFLDVYIKPVIMDLIDGLTKRLNGDNFLSTVTNAISGQSKGVETLNTMPGISGMTRAAGGVITMPSIVAERGPEAIVPLDYSRQQRAMNITNNISQSFSMGGSETTTLSLANAVKSRNFTRALDNSAFIRSKSL